MFVGTKFSFAVEAWLCGSLDLGDEKRPNKYKTSLISVVIDDHPHRMGRT